MIDQLKQEAAQSPIAVFAYRRPEHLRRTLHSLKKCRGFTGSSVFVFCDGPKSTAEHDNVQATRDVARAMLGDQASYRFSEANHGLSVSIISGVNEILKDHDRVIVIEDDLVLDEGFLKFMNEALDSYIGMENVFQVSGYMFNVPEIQQQGSALFLPITTSWGWGTWRRAWLAFEPDAPGWQKLLYDGRLRKRFNVDGTYDFSSMLVRQMLGFLDSWAVRWCWSVFDRNGLVLYPPTSMVRNTGFDGSGTHGRGILRRFSTDKSKKSGNSILMPKQVTIDPILYGYVKKALWYQNGRYLGRLVDKWRWLKTSYLAKRQRQ